MRNNCSKEFNMKKTGIIIAVIALVAAAGTFAQPSAKAKNADAKNAPGFREPPKFELPAEADVKAYHEAQAQSLKILLDAQVKAKIITPEWAEAKMAILKAVQADCKGFCILRRGTDIPFGTPGFEGPRKGQCDCHHGDRHSKKRFDRRNDRPHFDHDGFSDAAPQGEDSAILNER